MTGLLKAKSPGTQLLILISISIASFFILGLIGTVIVSSVSGMGLTQMQDTSKWDFSKSGPFVVIRGLQVVQFFALFLLPSLFCARLFSNNTGQYLGLKKPSKNFYWVAGAAVMIIALPLVEWLGILNQQVQFPKAIEQWMKDKENEAGKTIQSLLSRHTIKDLLLNVILIAGLAAVGEELMFRGMMQRLLIRIFKNPWVGIIVAAFIFSAFHLQFYGFLPRFMLGILLGVIYWYSGSLWASMLAHFVYDGLLIVLAYIYPEMANDDAAAAAKFSHIAVVALISLAFVMAIVSWMVRKSVIQYEEVYADDLVPVKDDPF